MEGDRRQRLRRLARLVLGQVLGLAAFAGGFWLLFLAFLNSIPLIGVLGGALMLAGMWLMASSRRAM